MGWMVGSGHCRGAGTAEGGAAAESAGCAGRPAARAAAAAAPPSSSPAPRPPPRRTRSGPPPEDNHGLPAGRRRLHPAPRARPALCDVHPRQLGRHRGGAAVLPQPRRLLDAGGAGAEDGGAGREVRGAACGRRAGGVRCAACGVWWRDAECSLPALPLPEVPLPTRLPAVSACPTLPPPPHPHLHSSHPHPHPHPPTHTHAGSCPAWSGT